MSLYAESSAILAWLLDEDAAPAIRRLLSGAELVVASDLTLIECDRVLHRAVKMDELTEVEAADRHVHLVAVSTHWHVLRLGPEIVERARRPFPLEPLRSLEAIHLAAALVARAAIAGLQLLSLDDRIRKAAVHLGLPVVPM